jgi:flagellar biosynthesis GTPase FlhF
MMARSAVIAVLQTHSTNFTEIFSFDLSLEVISYIVLRKQPMPRMNDSTIRIALMGVTGSGKSTFIKTASGLNAGVGHELFSCKRSFCHGVSILTVMLVTSEVAAYQFQYQGRDIVLIDTPGFNDTTKSETEVLKSIADYLDITYRNPPYLKLTGIIYLQSIMDPRMYGSSLRNLRMFRDLVGPSPLKNVILATTKWGQARNSGELDLAVSREEQLQTQQDFWAPMVQRGSHMARFEDSKQSALDLIMSLEAHQPAVLQIQSELVDQQKKLVETTAGNTVNEETIRLEKKYREEIAQIQKEMDYALATRDHELQEALKKADEGFQRKLDKVHAAQDMLRYERRNETRRMQDDIEAIKAAQRQDKEKHEREKEKYEKEIGTLISTHNLDKLDFDEVVARLKANEGKLREEQQVALQEKIDELDKKDSKGRTAIKLIGSLLPLLGSIVLGLLGLGGVGFGF